MLNFCLQEIKWQRSNKDYAVQYFDKTYNLYYGERWNSIRKALLSHNKHFVVVNGFGKNVESTSDGLKSSGGANLRLYYEKARAERVPSESFASTVKLQIPITSAGEEAKKNDGNIEINVELETDLTFPANLNIYAGISRDNLNSSQTNTESAECRPHFLMDGASILPPLVLDIKPTDHVYDACAGPGIKSLVLLQTMMPFHLVCNELKEHRLKRVVELFDNYLPGWSGWERCQLQQSDARGHREYGFYDKVIISCLS